MGQKIDWGVLIALSLKLKLTQSEEKNIESEMNEAMSDITSSLFTCQSQLRGKKKLWKNNKKMNPSLSSN